MQFHDTALMPKNTSIHVFGNCSGRCCSQRYNYTWSLSMNHRWDRGQNLHESSPKTLVSYCIQSFSIGISEKKLCSCDIFQRLKWVEGLWGPHLLGWRPIFHSISYGGGNSMTHCFFLHTSPLAPFHQLIQFGLVLRGLNQRPQLPFEAQHLLWTFSV